MNRLRYLFFLVLFSFLRSQDFTTLFEVDVRMRVVNYDLLYVVVQIDNNSGRTVTEIEGYITEVDQKNNIVSELRIVHLHNYEPPLGNGHTVVRGVTYSFDRSQDYRYRYHTCHLKFKGDDRIFIYSPAGELLRID